MGNSPAPVSSNSEDNPIGDNSKFGFLNLQMQSAIKEL